VAFWIVGVTAALAVSIRHTRPHSPNTLAFMSGELFVALLVAYIGLNHLPIRDSLRLALGVASAWGLLLASTHLSVASPQDTRWWHQFPTGSIAGRWQVAIGAAIALVAFAATFIIGNRQ